jgi:FAD/FMN-containing dehydrogenase/Fe-S oxidoreductase
MPIENFGLRDTGAKGSAALAARLRAIQSGEVLFDAFSRGRYATDASHYQIEPIGVVVPRSDADVSAILELAAREQLPVLPRGGGTSQCGQTVAEAIVVDTSKHLHGVLEFDARARTVRVQPGIVLDHLNAWLKPHGLWFPVDVSTSSRATIGGMTGNNSCGSRSLRYGTMRDNVSAVHALMTDGTPMCFDTVSGNEYLSSLPPAAVSRIDALLDLGRRERNVIKAGFPDLMRRVGGYNVDALLAHGLARGDWNNHIVHEPERAPHLGHLLVGSEGTLAFSTAVELKLQPLPVSKTLGVCHFPRFYDAMAAAQHLVKLGPVAVELVDRTMIGLSREIPLFRDTVDQFVKGDPDAVLLVEFAEDDQQENLRRLAALVEQMAELGFPDAVVEATDPGFQKAIWDVRKSGLNIMMSMKGDGKPLSFIEDCAVALEDLAEYTDRLTQVFHANGTEGTWYAHASVGCLHVRPVLNLKSEVGAQQLRDIAEAAFEMVREYKGSHSGEHGDGLVRSEFHEAMFGADMVAAFKEVKRTLDPDGLLNPGKIVDPPKMDDRELFRFKPGYQAIPITTGLDWSEWGGFAGAVEMCNNNGACRKRDAGVMCPSFRVTHDEQHLTRGRANTLRLALSGQLGPEALTSDDMDATMALCVGCKGCKRECPTGVDMARMKTEYLYQRRQRHGISIRERLVAYLPRYAPAVARWSALANLRDLVPGMAWLSEKLLGFSRHRRLPRWRKDVFDERSAIDADADADNTVVLLPDTFNTYFESENLHAAKRVLEAGGYRVVIARASGDQRPLCCGRTFLASGLLEEARSEAERTLHALAPYIEAGVAIVGLEPSCLLTLRDEFQALLPAEQSQAVAPLAMLFEEFLGRELDAGRLDLPLQSLGARRALLHGHCHQKAFGVMGPVQQVLKLVPELDVELIESSCCGMAGAFGYDAEHYDASMRMGELDLLPAARASEADTLLVADGTSCRHQIADGAQRQAVHVARVLADALAVY